MVASTGSGKAKKGRSKKSDSGAGKAGAKRHKKMFANSIKGITKPALRRLARRAGCKRVSAQIFESARDVCKAFCESVVFYALMYKDCFKRSTISLKDVNFALRKRGYQVLGTEVKRAKRATKKK